MILKAAATSCEAACEACTVAVSLGVSGDVALTAPGTYHSGTSTCEHTHPGSAIVVSSWASPSIVANMQQEHSHNQSNGVQAVKDVVTGGVNGRRCGGLGGGDGARSRSTSTNGQILPGR